MDLEINAVLPSSICEGCLSVDRKLTPVIDEESRKFFSEILDPLDYLNLPLSLCWECSAIIHRMLAFKKQIRYAHDCLVRYMIHQLSSLTSISSLAKSTGQTCHIIDHFDSTTLKDKIPNTFTNTVNAFETGGTISSNRNDHEAVLNTSREHMESSKHGKVLENTSRHSKTLKNTKMAKKTLRNTSKCVETAENAIGDDEAAQDGTKPLFIKMEGDECGDLEWFGDQDGGDQGDDGDGDKDLKPVLKSDPFPYEVPITGKNKSGTKRTRRNTRMEDFNDSDDEPLNSKRKKTEGKQYKPRSRRKKKENDEPKVDRRKHPAPKPEKPAGVVNSPRVVKKLQQLNVPSGQLEMVVLSWEEVEAERQKALTSEAFTRHEYRCYDCAIGFNHRAKLDDHARKHQPAAGMFECNACRVRSRDAHALCAHRRRHRVRWRCCLCGAMWSRAAVAADHHTKAHGAPPPTHVCPTCGHQETTLGKLRNHLKNHAERQKCELCGKTFRDRNSLRTHLFIHKGEKEYACPQCEKRFLFKKAMEIHLVTHDVSEQLYCYECDVNFKNRMSYYQHMKYNLKHIDPAKLKYACHLCEKKFAKASRLSEHNMAVHLKVTPIRCTTTGCNFACSSRPVLRTHIRMVHRNLRAVRNHVCDTCGKAYTTKKILEGHIRSHTGERPFQCGICPSTFGYQAALYNHNKLVHLKAKSGRGRTAPPPAPPLWPPLPAPLPPIPVTTAMTDC